MSQRLVEASPVVRLRRCREFTGVLDEVEDFAGVRDVVLPGLAELLGSHLAVYHEVDRGSGREVALGWPAETYRADLLGSYPLVVAHHPIVAYTMALPALGEPLRTSDLVSRRQWRANPVYCEAYRDLDVDDQIAFGATDHGFAFTGISVGRSGRSFTDWERDLVALVPPHVGAALQRAGGPRSRSRHSRSRRSSSRRPSAAGPRRPVLPSTYRLPGVRRQERTR